MLFYVTTYLLLYPLFSSFRPLHLSSSLSLFSSHERMFSHPATCCAWWRSLCLFKFMCDGTLGFLSIFWSIRRLRYLIGRRGMAGGNGIFCVSDLLWLFCLCVCAWDVHVYRVCSVLLFLSRPERWALLCGTFSCMGMGKGSLFNKNSSSKTNLSKFASDCVTWMKLFGKHREMGH